MLLFGRGKDKGGSDFDWRCAWVFRLADSQSNLWEGVNAIIPPVDFDVPQHRTVFLGDQGSAGYWEVSGNSASRRH